MLLMLLVLSAYRVLVFLWHSRELLLGDCLMTWFLYALLATILMTLVNFGDKFVVESQVPDPLALIIFLSFFNFFGRDYLVDSCWI